MATHSTAAAPAAAHKTEYKLPYFWQVISAFGGVLLLFFTIVKSPLEIAKLLKGEAKEVIQELALQKRARELRQQADDNTGIGCQWGNCYTGPGRQIFYDGSIYEGEFKYGQPSGVGIQVFPTGHIKEIEFYAGAFSLGQPLGKGYIQYANGNQYDGEVHGWQRNGRGTYLNVIAHEWHTGLWKGDRLIGE